MFETSTCSSGFENPHRSCVYSLHSRNQLRVPLKGTLLKLGSFLAFMGFRHWLPASVQISWWTLFPVTLSHRQQGWLEGSDKVFICLYQLRYWSRNITPISSGLEGFPQICINLIMGSEKPACWPPRKSHLIPRMRSMHLLTSLGISSLRAGWCYTYYLISLLSP